MIRRALVVVCLMAPLLTAELATISGGSPRKNSVQQKIIIGQNPIDVSAPLHDMFFTTTTMGIVPGLDSNGNPTYTATASVPFYDQANVVWQLSFDPVQFDTLSADANQQNFSNLQTIQVGIQSGSLTSLDVSLVDDFNGEATFGGYVEGAGLADLDRTAAMNTLLSPTQNVGGNTTVSACAFVSAPSLGLSGVPISLDGRIDSAYNPPAQMSGPIVTPVATTTKNLTKSKRHRGVQPQQMQQQQPVQLQWGGCSLQFGCATPPGIVCPVLKGAVTFEVVCQGQVVARYLQMPTNIQAGCTIRIVRGVQWVPGACNWTLQGYFRRRHWVCLCL